MNRNLEAQWSDDWMRLNGSNDVYRLPWVLNVDAIYVCKYLHVNMLMVNFEIAEAQLYDLYEFD